MFKKIAMESWDLKNVVRRFAYYAVLSAKYDFIDSGTERSEPLTVNDIDADISTDTYEACARAIWHFVVRVMDALDIDSWYALLAKCGTDTDGFAYNMISEFSEFGDGFHGLPNRKSEIDAMCGIAKMFHAETLIDLDERGNFTFHIFFGAYGIPVGLEPPFEIEEMNW